MEWLFQMSLVSRKVVMLTVCVGTSSSDPTETSYVSADHQFCVPSTHICAQADFSHGHWVLTAPYDPPQFSVPHIEEDC